MSAMGLPLPYRLQPCVLHHSGPLHSHTLSYSPSLNAFYRFQNHLIFSGYGPQSVHKQLKFSSRGSLCSGLASQACIAFSKCQLFSLGFQSGLAKCCSHLFKYQTFLNRYMNVGSWYSALKYFLLNLSSKSSFSTSAAIPHQVIHFFSATPTRYKRLGKKILSTSIKWVAGMLIIFSALFLRHSKLGKNMIPWLQYLTPMQQVIVEERMQRLFSGNHCTSEETRAEKTSDKVACYSDLNHWSLESVSVHGSPKEIVTDAGIVSSHVNDQDFKSSINLKSIGYDAASSYSIAEGDCSLDTSCPVMQDKNLEPSAKGKHSEDVVPTPSALYVYGRMDSSELQPNYSMLYAGEGISSEDHRSMSLKLVAGSSENHKRNIRKKRSSAKNGSTNTSQSGKLKRRDKMMGSGAHEGENDFDSWLADFKEEAIRKGVSRNVVVRVLEGVNLSQRILELDQNQPELKLSAQAYIGRMVDELRISKGMMAFRENKPLLEEISTKYGVPAPVLVAIWGIESSFGAFTGGWDTIQALVTLAFGCPKPTRAKFFREELIHALVIIEQGHGPLGSGKLQGSWAGAMGQCQFMPSSFLSYAVDYDGDGSADIWESRCDIFASMANYLRKHGWKEGCPLAKKVSVPKALDSSMLGLEVRKTLAEWQDIHEVQLLDEEQKISQSEVASLVAPDGIQGAAYLIFDNFRSLMRYNTSVLYALAVHELSNAVANESDSGQ